MTIGEADRLLRGFAAWAEKEPFVRGLALVGSWARGTARDDPDLDLRALTDQLDRWTANNVWLREVVAGLGFVATALDREVYGLARVPSLKWWKFIVV
jgi:predicted nucleotidyltransferase